jgi:large subunit ribosomal protein L9
VQIILKDDVRDLGRSGEIVTVAEGYARNYLLPRKLAVPATPGNLKDLHKRISAAKEREGRERAEADTVLARVRETRLTMTGRAAEGSTRLHGSITPENIATALSQALGIEFDRRSIELRNPIRTLGTHQVAIKMMKGMSAPLTVDVIDVTAQPQTVAAEAAAAPEAPAPAEAPSAAAAPVAPETTAEAPAAEEVRPVEAVPLAPEPAAAPESEPAAAPQPESEPAASG